MLGSSRCPCCGYRVAVRSGPYADPTGDTIESLTREVEYLRLVVSRRWGNPLLDGASTQETPRQAAAG